MFGDERPHLGAQRRRGLRPSERFGGEGLQNGYLSWVVTDVAYLAKTALASKADAVYHRRDMARHMRINTC